MGFFDCNRGKKSEFGQPSPCHEYKFLADNSDAQVQKLLSRSSFTRHWP